mgnify:CR=1 FL=1
MKKLMDQKEFAEKVVQYVRNALPEELSEAEVRAAGLDLWAGGARMALLLIRPWNDTAVGFRLDGWYQKYSDGNASVEDAAAAVINARRLYAVPSAGSGADALLEGGAVIYA